MATLVRDLFWGVSVDLGDHKPQFVRFKARELVRAYHEAQLVISRLLPPTCYRLAAVRLQPGSLQSIELLEQAKVLPDPGGNVQGIQFMELICNMGTNGSTPGRAISIADRGDLDSLDPLWHTKTGATVRCFTHDPRMPKHFHVEPAVPADTAVWVRAAFTAKPPELALPTLDDTDTFKVDGTSDATVGLPDEAVPDVHAYMVARLLFKESKWADPAKAARFTELFTGSMNTKVETLTGSNPNLKRLPLTTEPLTAAQ